MRYVLAYCQVRGCRKAVCTKSPTTLWTKSLVCFRHISASVNVHLKKPKQTKNLNFKEECSVPLHLPPVFSFKHPQNSVTHTHTQSTLVPAPGWTGKFKYNTQFSHYRLYLSQSLVVPLPSRFHLFFHPSPFPGSWQCLAVAHLV